MSGYLGKPKLQTTPYNRQHMQHKYAGIANNRQLGAKNVPSYPYHSGYGADASHPGANQYLNNAQPNYYGATNGSNVMQQSAAPMAASSMQSHLNYGYYPAQQQNNCAHKNSFLTLQSMIMRQDQPDKLPSFGYQQQQGHQSYVGHQQQQYNHFQ